MVIRTLVFVAAGGASGAVARYLLSNAVHALVPMRFPLATLGVNLLGSLLIGILYVLIAERGVLHPEWRSVPSLNLLMSAVSWISARAMTTHSKPSRMAISTLSIDLVPPSYAKGISSAARILRE